MQGDRSKQKQTGLNVLIVHVIQSCGKVGCPTNPTSSPAGLSVKPMRKDAQMTIPQCCLTTTNRIMPLIQEDETAFQFVS